MKYFGGFDDRQSVACQFRHGVGYPDKPWWEEKFSPAEDFPTEEEILFASYHYADYEGNALVLYERNGQLYEVNGSHCSCYGLEEQWKPEATSWDALAARKYWGLCDASEARLAELIAEHVPVAGISS